MATTKTTHQLRKGDRVTFHGGVFFITTDAVESQAHRPEGYWPAAGVGPSDCVAFDSVCESGTVPGYFAPGTPWTVQGNQHATWSCI
jgi:hypothetical protein